MINFFRKTRKKLADDNKFFKYSRYAIGEIVLVVVGILIALQINDWNENRKLLLNEHALYKKLIADLTDEELRLENQINWAKSNQDLHYAIYNKTKGKFDSDSVIPYYLLQTTFTYLPMIKDIYEETHDKISNENIRDLIKKYFTLENSTRLAIEDYNDYKIQFMRPFLVKHGLFNLEPIFNDQPYSWPSKSNFKFINSNKLLEHYGSNELDGILVQLRLHISWVIKNFHDLKESNQNLVLALDNEIKKE